MRMTVNEIEKFIAKLKSTEPQGYPIDHHKYNAIVSLEILCDLLSDRGKNSMRVEG